MRISALLKGNDLRGRSVRSSLLTLADFSSQNVLRLVGNLILTRILFPEAFGIMALVTVVMTGLRMFSDVGLKPSIIQNKRGDDPLFLDTAWVLQIARGVLLWVATWVAAAPVAAFYEAPILAELLPVAGLMALFQGFNSTKLAVANRHLQMGRVTVIAVGSRVVGLAVLIVLALWLESVWALVIGGLVSPFIVMVLSHTAVPGPGNRLRFDPSAAGDLLHFGKYIFLSTLAGFLISQADRAILGKFVTLSDLALYNIAIMLATIPRLLQQRLAEKVLFPLYSKRPPAESRDNYRNMARARLLVGCGSLVLVSVLAIGGDILIRFLYDVRYEAAGPLLVLMAIAAMPALVTGGYGYMIMTHGHSGRFALMTVCSAILRTIILLLAIMHYGVIGAVLAPLVSVILFYPALLWFIAPYKGWVPVQDLGFTLASLGVALCALWFNEEAIRTALEVFALQ